MTTNAVLEPVSANEKLRLFTLYADFPAGVRAKRLITRLASRPGRDWDITAEMWKLDSISPTAAIRDMIAQEAGESDVLVFASGAAELPDPEVAQWLGSLVNWKLNRSVPGLLVGLAGSEDRAAEESNWLVAELAAFARRTSMDFVWRAAARELAEDLDWLAEGVRRLVDRKRSYLADTHPVAFAGVTLT